MLFMKTVSFCSFTQSRRAIPACDFKCYLPFAAGYFGLCEGATGNYESQSRTSGCFHNYFHSRPTGFKKGWNGLREPATRQG
jgi:hypothetical protein